MPELTATAPSTAPDGPGSDQSLPDPSQTARSVLLVLLIVAVIVAVVMNAAHLTAKPFVPPKTDIGFALLAGFYAGAQIIERLMELIAPLLPAWPPSGSTGSAKVVAVKADRGPERRLVIDR